MNKITAQEVRELTACNRVVMGYPRKGLVVVDGFKRYAASAAVAKLALSLSRAHASHLDTPS